MKKIWVLLALCWFTQIVHAAQPLFEEGVHYDELPFSETAQPEIMEFFSYLCPNCAKFEPIIDSLRGSLPTGVSLKKNPIDFLGRDNMGSEMQRAYAVAGLLGVERTLTTAMFHQIYSLRQPPQSREDIKNVFVAKGVSAKAFDVTVDSFTVSGMLEKYNRNAKNFKIKGVPAFVINGKYIIKINAIKEQAQFNQLVDFLLTKRS